MARTGDVMIHRPHKPFNVISQTDGVHYLFNVDVKVKGEHEVLAGRSEGREYLVVSQCAHVCQRSVRFGDWLYTRTYHDGHHGFPREMLFDLKNDPFEQQDLAGERRDVCKEAVYLLNEWHDGMMASMEHDTDPLWTVMREGGPYHAKDYAGQETKS